MNHILKTNELNCRYCGTQMRLFGIERDADHDGLLLRSYECPHCKSLHTHSEAAVQLHLDRLDSPNFASEDGTAFDDSSLKLLAIAFDAAWRIVETSRNALYRDPKMARDQLAQYVIAQGMDGERDPLRLVASALAFLGVQNSAPAQAITFQLSAAPL
jgi:hypothetical protein